MLAEQLLHDVPSLDWGTDQRLASYLKGHLRFPEMPLFSLIRSSMKLLFP